MRLLFADADGWTAVSRDGLQVPVEFSDTQGVIYIRAHAADDGVFLLAPGMKHSSGDLGGGGERPIVLLYKNLSYRRGTARCVVSVEICQFQRNSAETTYSTSPDQIDGMKLEI